MLGHGEANVTFETVFSVGRHFAATEVGERSATSRGGCDETERVCVRVPDSETSPPPLAAAAAGCAASIPSGTLTTPSQINHEQENPSPAPGGDREYE